eukprot:m.15353 g.15353  ORF g.15353 m.15353 type:complete len:388 (+) comp26325_c0_seq3:48-1211(+)
MLPLHANDLSKRRRGLFFVGIQRKIVRWIRSIFSDPTSRNLFGFLIINLSFAFVELAYGIWTNCLGLISDSFHMFFDCTALLAGLIATVVSKWHPNDRFSFGYVRVEVLAGFVNGLFLLFIAFFIFSEAMERFFEPPEVKHERLLLVSIGGFLVNLVGIFAFSHGGHGHSHAGGGHGHSHSPGKVANIHTSHNSESDHGHKHEHGHNHSHSSHEKDEDGHMRSDSDDTDIKAADERAREVGKHQIMQGVFLHVLADTLGSVGVVISSILIDRFGCMVADPICSIVISILIAMSVLPLIRSSLCILMQRSPSELDAVLPDCYRQVMQINGVYGIHEPHFWTLCTDYYVGTLRVQIASDADSAKILHYVRSIFIQAGVTQVVVQLEYSQ